MGRFELKTTFEPAGDQPQAIASLCAGLDQGMPHQVLLGATGTGKTFTMAHLIAHADKPRRCSSTRPWQPSCTAS